MTLVTGGLLATQAAAADRVVRVLVWDEQQPAQKQAYGDRFLGETIAAYLSSQPGFAVRTAKLDSPEQGLSEAALAETDVLIWWGHVRHREVSDEAAERVVRRVEQGRLALVALHSAHWAKPFVRLMQRRAQQDARQQIPESERATAQLELVNEQPIGVPVKRDTPLTPRLERAGQAWRLTLPACVFPAWRADGAPSHVTTLLPDHPLARGLPARWHIGHTEMYDEPFHVPPPDAVVFEEQWDQGERFRSGCLWRVGRGQVFYFRPGHETFAVYHNAEPLRVVENAARWLGTQVFVGWTPTRTLDIQRVGAVQVSPDGRRVAYTVRRAVLEDARSEFVTQIHLSNSDGSATRQLTQGDRSCDDPQWSPDGRWLALVTDRAGKKNVWLMRPDGGEALQLTNFPGGIAGYRWSPDGRQLAVSALDPPTADEERAVQEKSDVRVLDENIKRHRLYVVPVTDPPARVDQPRLLVGGDTSVNGDGARPGRVHFDWSPDGRTIVFSHVRTPRPDDWPTAQVSLVEVASGKVVPLLQTPAAEHSPLFSPDGRWIAVVVSDSPPTWAGTGRVHVLPAAGGDARPLASTQDGFGRYSELIGWSADSQQIYYTEARGVDLWVLALPLAGGAAEVLEREPRMALTGVNLNVTRTHLGAAWETCETAPEAWVRPLAAPAAVRVSRVNEEWASSDLGRTEVVRWKSTEGLEVEGLLTYPVGYQPGQRYPLLLVIHGGPMGVFSRSCLASPGTYPVAVFAARGYAVLRPNPRGSSGYGAAFRHANRGDWGGGDYRDVMAGVDHVIAAGVADPERLGVMGWSYGGFLTSWIITQTKRFQCASVGAGVTNLMSFTGTADIPGFLPDYFGGEFWDRPETYASHSAMFRVRGVTTPTLIQHGERDERVPLSQGLELYNALKRQGCTTRMIVYPRTPHGIEEPRLLLDAMERNVEWFDRYLQPNRSPTPTR
ncbi:MAG: prolyl oligopeptidase family serine peptidase [Pirellulales bacterium]